MVSVMLTVLLAFGLVVSTALLPTLAWSRENLVSIGEITDQSNLNSLPSAPRKEEVVTPRLFFTGDVMLGRHVEYLMSQNGPDYPYRGDLPWRPGVDIVVGNFEASIPVIHRKTPNFGFQFSVDSTYLTAFASAGFTHASLANNHAFDHGVTGFANAYSQLALHNVQPFGHPQVLASSSVTYLTVGEVSLAVLGLHTLGSAGYDESELETLINEMSTQSALQVAYIHWGDEYVVRPNVAQRNLASTLVAHGIDLVIGHHPHVVQSIEYIDGVPVFYSLGNFIFDQYFSAEVQQGLVLELEVDSDDHKVLMWPVSSLARAAQPSLMTGVERDTFLSVLSGYSDPALAQDILSGHIAFRPRLASSSEIAIIEP